MKIPDFNDIIFERRNKEYGAYFLRKRYNRVVILSVFAAIILGSALVLIPYLNVLANKNKTVYTTRSVMLENLMADEPSGGELLPPPPAPPVAEAPASLRAPENRYVAPEVVDTILQVETPILSMTDSISDGISDMGSITGTPDGKGISTGAGGGSGGGTGGGNGLYSAVDEMPKFKGGDINKFREWVQKKTVYSYEATANGIQGKVYITFIVEMDGTVSSVKVAKGVDPLIDDAALKAVKSSPKWTPGKRRGEVVRVYYIISVNFEL